jgi:hypothetical protein
MNSPGTTTTTVTQPLFSNALSSQQQHNEIFVPNKVKLEPINRSQLIIQSTTIDDQEPVNMSKKENVNDIDDVDDEDDNDDDDDDDTDTNDNHHQSTHNLLTNVSSTVVHVWTSHDNFCWTVNNHSTAMLSFFRYGTVFTNDDDDEEEEEDE